MGFSNYISYLEELLGSLDEVIIIGGAAMNAFFGLTRELSDDFDIYSSTDLGEFKGFKFLDGVYLDVVDSLATDSLEYETIDSITCLTNYLFSNNSGFVTRKKGLRVLNLKGLFISKLAALNEEPDRLKDLDDLCLIYEQWHGKVPPSVVKVINNYGLVDVFDEYQLNLEQYIND